MAWRLLCTAVIAAAVGPALAGSQSTAAHTFDQTSVGTLPSGFTLGSLRQPTSGRWAVERVGTALALQHSADAGATGWSLALAPETHSGAWRMTTRLRLGGTAPAGGIVWHYADARNFMAVMLDLREGELELFRVTDGNRIQLEDRDGLELDRDAWHTLRVSYDNGRTTVSIAGIRVLDEEERRPVLINGRVGLMAHGGATAAFDDLRVEVRQNR